ncbi:MAG: 50S ribosomal protein L29 [Kribbellaceae bacterium]|nr:50S ribosomal protein L29 [Kribbellaceae bacterium]
MATLTAAELRNLGRDELLEKLGSAKEELFNLRFQAATGQLESHGRLRAVRKDIARIYTVLTERALGITDDVDGDSVPALADDSAAEDAESETREEAKA